VKKNPWSSAILAYLVLLGEFGGKGKPSKKRRSGIAIIHLFDSNVFIPIGLRAKVFLNLAPQSVQEFC
jgi:hypothetical protein